MFRILLAALIMTLVVHPAWAGPQESANVLFVDSVKLIQAAINESDVEERLNQLTEAQEILQRIIEDYPSSDVAVKLISGQSIGDYSLGSVQYAVEWASAKLLEQQELIAASKREERAKAAAVKIEELLSQLEKTQTLVEGKRLAEEIATLIDQLKPDFGATRYLDDLQYRFDDQYRASYKTWTANAYKPVELMITKLKNTQSLKETDPLIKIIDKELTELSQTIGSLSYHQSTLNRFESVQSALPYKWEKPWADEIWELITELKAAKTAKKGLHL